LRAEYFSLLIKVNLFGSAINLQICGGCLEATKRKKVYVLFNNVKVKMRIYINKQLSLVCPVENH
jgi:hypothetical protein